LVLWILSLIKQTVCIKLCRGWSDAPLSKKIYSYYLLGASDVDGVTNQ
jgi:hypothetical protein